jgi:SAM-dependent methyltransferase
MSHIDRDRWNARYLEYELPYSDQPRRFLVSNVAYLPKAGLALDAAMGLGGNAGFLLDLGLRVIGIDISEIALRAARQRFPALMAVQADLTQLRLPAQTFDLIMNFNYLERSLWSQYMHALKPGGILIIETLTEEFLEQRPEIDPAYLLARGELPRLFPKLEILVHREVRINEDGHLRPLAGLVARRPMTDP